MKKILITGAAGFIGFHLAQALLNEGNLVIGLDNFNDYYDPQLKCKRSSLLEKRGMQVIQGDVTDDILLEDLFQKNQFTHVVHLAAQAGVRYALVNPKAYLTSNLEGFLTILELCKHHPDIHMVYASSSSVYGCNEKIPFSITDSTDQPANLYAATKKSNELMAYSYHHLFGISAVGLRYFTVYGPWGRPDMAYYNFTKSILAEKPITLFNNGNMQRDFTYIDDIVSGTMAAINLKSPGYEVFNLGNNKSIPLLSFVKLLEQGLEKKAIIEMKGETRGEVISTYADISESEKKLGFSPKTSLEEGLNLFIHWYRDYHV